MNRLSRIRGCFLAGACGDALGWLPAAMLADMVHRCLVSPELSLRDIALTSLARLKRLWAHQQHWADFDGLMRKAMQLAERDIADEEAITLLGEGWVGDEALAIALYCCLRHPDNIEDCLSAAVTHKGDSDSTGAIAGNLLGAYLGEEAIPVRWLERLEARETIEEMVHRMAEADA